MTKKIFAMFLAVLMVVSLLPASVFAVEDKCPGKGEHTLENCSYIEIKTVAPGCGTMGFTTYQCTVCGEYFSASWVSPTGDHQWDYLPERKPTCSTAGYAAGKQCTVCELKVPGAVIPALGVNKQCEWEDLTPHINCEEGGMKKYACVYCGATFEQEVKPGNHVWNEKNPQLVTEPTATAKGLAYVYCTICGDHKEVEVLNSHDHAWFFFEGYDKTCTENGLKDHFVCRVCGEIRLNKNDDETIVTEAQLVIPAGHSVDHATCVDKRVTCDDCGEYVDVKKEHTFDWKESDWQKGDERYYFEYEAPTCTVDGWMADWCDVCKHARHVQDLPAPGHTTVTITIPATCATYGYTFTYCTNANCDEIVDVEFPTDVTDETLYSFQSHKYNAIEEMELGKGYYLNLNQANHGKPLYFTGAMSGNFLAASDNYRDAVLVYLEKGHCLEQLAGNYFLYFYNAEGVKTYIEIYEWDTTNHKVGVHLTTNTPTNFFNWNDELSLLTTTINGKDYYLGTYNNYGTISASETTYITGDNASKVGVSQFPAYLADPTQFVDVQIIDYKFDVTAKFNSNNHHVAGYTEVINIKPTCTDAGEKMFNCELCGDKGTVVIPAGHDWTDYANKDEKIVVNGVEVDVFVADCCTGGYKYQYCANDGCTEVRKVNLTGRGHYWYKLVNNTPDHNNTTTQDYYECYCGEKQVVRTEKWAYGSTKFDLMADAQAAHSGCTMTLYWSNPERTNCYKALYDQYKCSGCNKIVEIKIEGTGAHSNPTDYKAPGCVEGQEGGFSTYKCAVCGILIGDAALGEWNVIAPLGHNFEIVDGYKAAPCDAPIYDHIKTECTRCGATETDGTAHIWTVGYTSYCTAGTFQYYMCHCGKEHIRNFVNVMGCEPIAREHYMVDANGEYILDKFGNKIENPDNYKSATCYEAGYEKFDCKWCKEVITVTLNKTEHKNAAGEVIDEKCTSTVTDRHCVECCKYMNNDDHTTKGKDHICSELDKNEDNVLDCLGHCIIGKPCHYIFDEKMPSTCLMDAYTLQICGDCNEHTVTPWTDPANSLWNGHRPEDNYEKFIEVPRINEETGEYVYDEMGKPLFDVIELPDEREIELVNYIYKPWTWVSVEVVNNEFVYNTVSYTAKFIEYVEPTYTSEGYWTAYCEECKQIETVIIPKKTGLEFNLTVQNPIEAAKNQFTFGSEIEVIISTNAAGDLIHGFDFELAFAGELALVKAESMNDNFNFFFTRPENVEGNVVEINGYAVNDVNGNRQNILVDGQTALVKLTFRSMSYEAATMSFTFDNDTAYAYAVNGLAEIELFPTYCNATAFNRQYLDFNRDNSFSVKDMFHAMTLVTGEHPTGIDYDVTFDINKDGVVELEEIWMAYEHSVGNYSKWDLFILGISEAELDLLGMVFTDVCHNPTCQYPMSADWNQCPMCGNYQ